MERRGIGVAPESLNAIFLVRRRRARLGIDFVDDLGRGAPGKSVIAAYSNALFDLERTAGSHDVLALAQTGQHERARGIDASGRLADQALDELRLRDFLEDAGPRH